MKNKIRSVEVEQISNNCVKIKCGNLDEAERIMESLNGREKEFLQQLSLKNKEYNLAQELYAKGLILDRVTSKLLKAINSRNMQSANLFDLLKNLRDINMVACARVMLISKSLYPESVFQSVITKKIWKEAVAVAAICQNYEISSDIITDFVDDDEKFGIFYAQVVMVIIALLGQKPNKVTKAEVRASEFNKLKKEYELLERQIESLQKENAKLRDNNLKDQSKQILPLERALRKKESELEEAKKELSCYKKIDDYYTDVEEGTRDIKLLELPEQNIIFVGGHVNLRNRLKAVFPGWSFISADAVVDYGSPDFVFLYTSHLSHKQFEHVKLHCKAPILYCKGTNIDILTKSMKVSYTTFKSKSS